MLQYTFNLSFLRSPMAQHNVPNRSSMSQTQTQTAIVCLLMIRVSPDDMSASFFFFLFSSFLFFYLSLCLCSQTASFSLIYVHPISLFLSIPSFPLQGGYIVDRQTERADLSLKGTQRHDGHCTTKTLDQGLDREIQRIKGKKN